MTPMPGGGGRGWGSSPSERPPGQALLVLQQRSEYLLGDDSHGTSGQAAEYLVTVGHPFP